MCDYSLHAIPNRLAVEGEQLVTYRFPTTSMGLASECDVRRATCQLQVKPADSLWSVLRSWLSPPPLRSEAIAAVCIPPGARLRVQGIPEDLQKELGVGPEEEVTFVQLSASAYRYRDGFRFKNGRAVLLQSLREGIRAEVLSLELAEPEPEHEYEHEQARVRVR